MKDWIAAIITIIMSMLGVCHACAGGKHALLIGISDYPDYGSQALTWKPIHGAVDVASLTAVLRVRGFEIKTLTNADATATRIRDALAALAADCHRGDLVYVHFSGHGQAYEDLSGDEADGWDEALVPYDAPAQYVKDVYEGEKHLLDDELDGYLSAIRLKAGPEGFVYMVIDACHSGGASRGDEAEAATATGETIVRGSEHGFSPNGRKYIPRIDRRGNMTVASRPGMAGICILEACRAYQTNAEIFQDGSYRGPLSYYVGLMLRKFGLTPSTGWVEKVRELMDADKRLIRQNMVIEKSD